MTIRVSRNPAKVSVQEGSDAAIANEGGAMHLLQSRTYAGSPGEMVTVDADVDGSGAITIVIDGIEVGEDPTFPLKANTGDETHMRIALFGAVGESCVVRISTVDGGADGDLLLCQTLDPAPIHLYRFIVAPTTALAALDAARESRRAGPAPQARKTTKKTGRGKK